MNQQNSRHIDEDLIALIDAVELAKLPESPPINRSTAILIHLQPSQFDQLTECRMQVARELGRQQVTVTELFSVLVQELLADEVLKTRVIEVLRDSL